ncbi:putative Glucose-methanol-choline oxidoreductase N-terminal domain-containing protein [Seiridium cardinale]|uniref:Glucose-methanol-choline oxidoreductase N-terminal domain-containing protein n=1 Tax=Seiridium cardinale TaxID=138064 RepID=A0ABR2X818_9PEZI
MLRGKVLGGSSALNFMVWNRASVAEYNAWGEVGNPGWNWESVSEGMVQSENFTNLNLTEAGFDVCGTQGPIHTTLSRYVPENELFSVDSKWDWSYSANSYLPQAGPNLEVLANTRVARVNLKETANEGFTATGITFGNSTIIQARQEVIISAAGIEQLIELPGVGEHLQDHLRVQLVWQLEEGHTSLGQLIYNSTFAAEQLALWENQEYSIYDEVPNGNALLS